MTSEVLIEINSKCAFAKLSYILGKGLSTEETRKLLKKNLRGELFIPTSTNRFSYQLPSVIINEHFSSLLLNDFINSREVKTNSPENSQDLFNIGIKDEVLTSYDQGMISIIACNAAKVAGIIINNKDLPTLEYIYNEFNSFVGCDNEKRVFFNYFNYFNIIIIIIIII